MEKDRIEMSQRDRDVLKVMSLVLKGERTQAEAARLLGKSERQVRRVQRRLEAEGDGGVVHRLRGRPSNRRIDEAVRREVLEVYRRAAWYSDRHGIFRAEEVVGGERVSVPTQFSRALAELGVELILAGSPQAKGRVERLWGTLQDRWVKELRLAGVTTMDAANALVEAKLLPEFNLRFTVKPASGNDAH